MELQSKRSEQRAHVRVRLRLFLRLRGTEPSGKAFEEITTTENVSAEGFMCNCMSSLVKGSIVEVILSSRGEHYVGQARVVRKETSGAPWQPVWLPVRGEDPRLALAVEECHFALVKPFSRLPQSFQRNPIWLSQALGRCAGPGRRPIPVGGSPRWRSASFLPGVKQERYCALFRRRGSSVEPDHARKWDPVTLKAADGTWHVRRWIRDRDCSKALEVW